MIGRTDPNSFFNVICNLPMSRKNWSDEKLMSRLLNNKTEKTYWDNIHELRSRAGTETFNKCIALVKSKEPLKRRIALDLLAQFGTPPRPFYKVSKEIFFDILNNETDSKVIESALYAVSHNNGKLNSKDVAAICKFKNNEDSAIRKALAFALLGLNNKEAIDTLILLSADKFSFVRDWATFGIGTQIKKDNKAIRKALRDRTEDKDEDVRYEAIAGLAARNDNGIIEIIMLELSKPNVRSLLFEAITALKAVVFLPKLKKLFNESKNDEEISHYWKNELKSCIRELKEIKSTTDKH